MFPSNNKRKLPAKNKNLEREALTGLLQRNLLKLIIYIKFYIDLSCFFISLFQNDL